MPGGLEEQANQAMTEFVLRIIRSSNLAATPATVVSGSFDQKTRTVKAEPQDGGPQVKVNLQGLRGSDKGLLQVPAGGSLIVIEFLDDSSAVMVLSTELEETFLDVEKFTMNGGDNGGLIKIEELVNRMNAIESAHNNLITALASWVDTNGDSPNPATVTAMQQQTVAQTQKSQLENAKIKH